jgi:hypothetical protein
MTSACELPLIVHAARVFYERPRIAVSYNLQTKIVKLSVRIVVILS